MRWSGLALALVLAASGCRGVATRGEQQQRQSLAATGQLRPATLPPFTAQSPLRAAVMFGVQNQPTVVAAYEDWAAAVENITVARSLPDPKLTFQAYIQDSLTSLMPGLTMDIPGYGKRDARAAVATAESRAKYFQFVQAAQQAAFDVQKSYYPLHFLEAKLAVNRQTLRLLGELEALARGQNEVGQGSLQDVLKVQIEQKKLQTDTTNLEDSRTLLLAQFKAALGLRPDQPDPAVPQPDFTDNGADDEAFLAGWQQTHPQLQALRAEIELAGANLQMAVREKNPDFSVGLQAEVYEPPFYWPSAGVSLPIWRDKLAAERAAAEAGLRSARARLSAGEITLATSYAEKSFAVRSADRQLRLLRQEILPRARQSLEIAQAAYRAGRVDFLNVIDAERALLNFQLDEIAAQIERETARAELILLVAAQPVTTPPAQATHAP